MGAQPPGYIPNPNGPGYIPANGASSGSAATNGESGQATGGDGGMDPRRQAALSMLLSRMGSMSGPVQKLFGNKQDPAGMVSPTFSQAVQSAQPQAGGFGDDSIGAARQQALADFMQRGQLGTIRQLPGMRF